jgi:NodT family efflux transporter outer membrane factor (OMF) lipoprotein
MVGPVFRFKSLLTIGLIASASGCATVPQLGPRAVPVAAESLASTTSFAAPRGDWPHDAWWTGFGDPQLDQLVAEALAGSPDLRAAAARVRAAEALAQQAGAALLPSAGLEASAGGQRQSQNLGIPPQFVPDGIQDVGRIAGTFSLDLDLWGRNRAALAAATSEAEAARVDAAQTRLLLATNLAAAYADLAGLFAQRDVAEDAVRVRGATAGLTQRRVDNGLDTRGELRQAESRVPAARADLAAIDESIALTRNRIAALLGAGPDRGLAVTRPRLSPLADGLPDRLALDLLGRRPDIVAARLRTEANASRIRQARAAFYPNINLTALIGLQSLGLDKLFQSGSTIASFGPALTLPIFEGGRLQGQYRGARAQYDESVARYDATLVTALREVADAAASLRALDSRLAEQRAALAAAEEAARIARLRFEGGLANQLTALQADDQLLLNRRAVADLEARRLTLDIALVRALGGGFQAAPKLAAGN